MDITTSGNKYSLYINYSANNQNYKFEIGNDKDQISLELLFKILDYSKTGDQNSFQAALAEAMYGGLSEKEKLLLNLVKNSVSQSAGSNNLQLFAESIQEDDYAALNGLPTEAYLKHLKEMEELDFKNRETEKFRKKMQKISGNQPMDELIFEANGTSMKFSNVHVTDIQRLDNSRINSPNF